MRTTRYRQQDRGIFKVHTQEFGSNGPAALDDILEFVILTQLSLGRSRAGVVKISRLSHSARSSRSA